ncbi:amino acid permease [Actinocrinis puniceicyclus]|uniref:Amino acid permease n=1 Tax=Actinocrinis puniceicyclus TaxID=977794 RepID=A0A8J7WNZ2_9ACTN|nr:amino acid permease [Actinocrinis puniceicyclus]MBS2962925.1 amino acid permease [Actinocrinis puniceicyclus]
MSSTTRASRDQRSAGAVLLDDDQRLHELGYPRKLSRRLTWFDNFAVSFTIINIIAGVFTGFGVGFGAGGPRTLVWGWIVVSTLVLFVGAAMAEVCSAYPTSGALYYWAAKLAKRHNAAWSWFTGWLNFAGQIAGTAATDFAAASFINILLAMEWSSYNPTKYTTLGIFAAILFVHALANTYTVRLVGLLNRISVWWLLVGALLIVGALVLKPSHHESAGFVFTQFKNETGFSNGLYAAMIGLLSTAWVFTGFDASAHMTEETSRAAISAPRGIVRSIAYSAVGGFVLMLSLIWSVQNYGAELGSGTGFPSAQIVLDAVGGGLAKLLLVVVTGALLFCGLANLTSNSRQIFAFSRDGAIPGSRLWHSVNPRTGTPVKSVWFAAVGAFILVLPSLWSSVAFQAVVSVNVIGLFGSYAVPIFLRVRRGADFEAGPWNLGRWSGPVSVVAVLWVFFSSILFLLPQSGPITWHSLNYAPIALGVVLLISTLWWFVTARRTFNGPISYGTPEELAALENELI